MYPVALNSSQKEEWDNFVKDNAQEGGLLQSWAWGDFQESLGKKVWRIGLEDKNGELAAGALLIRDDLSLRQTTLDIPRGPLLRKDILARGEEDIFSSLKELFQEIEKVVREEGVMVIRVDWPFKREEGVLEEKEWRRVFKKLGFHRSFYDWQPRSTLWVNLERDIEDIFASFKPKHRYNIRLAIKKGVKAERVEKNKEQAFEKFWQILKKTAQRDGFSLHEKQYYWQMINTPGIDLYAAYYNEEIVAGAIVGCFGDFAVYLHGGMDIDYRQIMAPYLLHAQIIKDVKEKRKVYDLGGVQSAKEKSVSQEGWIGITRFKKGFAPQEETVEFFGLWEKPILKSNYFIYQVLRLLKK